MNNKQSKFSSIKWKIIILLVVALLVEVVAICVACIPRFRSQYAKSIQNNIYDLSEAYGNMLEYEITNKGADTLDVNTYKSLFSDVKIEGADTSYAYLVSADGTMLYHPTDSKIGKPVENAVVTSVVSDLKAGKKVESKFVAYEYNGAMKYAGYYVTQDSKFILVVTADEDDILSSLSSITTSTYILSVICFLSITIIGLIVIRKLTDPLNKLTVIIQNLSSLDFRKSDSSSALNNRKDEIGNMSKAVTTLGECLSNVTSSIKSECESIAEASNTLTDVAEKTNDTVMQIDSSIADVAKSSSVQAEETTKAADNISEMGKMIEQVTNEFKNLSKDTEYMRTSTEDSQDTLSELIKTNTQAVNSISIINEQTNTTNESAVKIKEATSLITSIAEETNLLSLNASIEAARAGEQGKGFAVVASEIQKLAEQSNESARKIDDIVTSLIDQSSDAVTTMNNVKQVMQKQNDNVSKTEKSFAIIKQRIDSSIKIVDVLSNYTKELDEIRVKVIDNVQTLAAIAEENAASTEENSAAVSQVKLIVQDVSDNADNLKNVVSKLEEQMNQFTI